MRQSVLRRAMFFAALIAPVGNIWHAMILNAQETAPPEVGSKTLVVEVAETDDKQTLLPNGWKLTPAGKQVILTDLPLNILTSPDGRYAFVATNGFNTHDLSVIELETGRKIATEAVRQSWFGVAADFTTGRIWWSGGGNCKLHSFQWADGQFKSVLRADVPRPAAPTDRDRSLALTAPFLTGVCHDSKQEMLLYSLAILPRGVARTFASGDTQTEVKAAGFVTRTSTGKPAEELAAPCGKRPYDILRARNGLLYVSDWADRCVLVVDQQTLRTISRIPVGEHPTQLAAHPADDRIFVACASSNGVWVIDTSRGTVQETIFTALFPKSPEGSTQYSTAGMLRTIELILGLPPLSQYDAAATPMFESFSDQPDLTAYVHEKARIDLNVVNTPLAYGADRSSKMDFAEYDRIDDFELNEILWHSIKGPDALEPPSVRRAIAYRRFDQPE